MEPCPQDVLDYVEECGLPNRKIALQKNVGAAFASGLMVAEIIHSHYPKLIELHNYSDSLNQQGKLANWRLLKKKLSLFSCELSDGEINEIVNRSCNSAEIFKFLRKLKLRLPSYEPIYLAKQVERNSTQQRVTSRTMSESVKKSSPSKLTATNLQKNQQKTAKFSTKTMGTAVSNLNIRKSSEAPKKLSKSRTNQIMESIWERQERVKKVAEMSDEDIERMYAQLTARYRQEADDNNAKAAAMNQRSKQIDDHFAALREENLRDMNRTARRLSLLQQKPQMRDSVMGFEFDPVGTGSEEGDIESPEVDEDEEGSFEGSMRPLSEEVASVSLAGSAQTGQGRDPSMTKIKKKYTSRRSSAISDQLMAMMPVTEGEQSSSPTESRNQQQAPLRSSDLVEDDESGESDSDGEAPPPPPPKKNHVVSLPAAPNTTLKFTEEPSVMEAPAIHRPSYKRVWHAQYKRHYYIHCDTNSSQWDAPKEGIVECVDEANGNRKYFTDSRTGHSGWTLEELQL